MQKDTGSVLREDLLRLESKIDAIGTQILQMTERLVAVEQRPLYRQPCADLKSHLQRHETCDRDWRNALIQFVISLLIAALCGLVGYLFRINQELRSANAAKSMTGDTTNVLADYQNF